VRFNPSSSLSHQPCSLTQYVHLLCCFLQPSPEVEMIRMKLLQVGPEVHTRIPHSQPSECVLCGLTKRSSGVRLRRHQQQQAEPWGDGHPAWPVPRGRCGLVHAWSSVDGKVSQQACTYSPACTPQLLHMMQSGCTVRIRSAHIQCSGCVHTCMLPNTQPCPKCSARLAKSLNSRKKVNRSHSTRQAN